MSKILIGRVSRNDTISMKFVPGIIHSKPDKKILKYDCNAILFSCDVIEFLFRFLFLLLYFGFNIEDISIKKEAATGGIL